MIPWRPRFNPYFIGSHSRSKPLHLSFPGPQRFQSVFYRKSFKKKRLRSPPGSKERVSIRILSEVIQEENIFIDVLLVLTCVSIRILSEVIQEDRYSRHLPAYLFRFQSVFYRKSFKKYSFPHRLWVLVTLFQSVFYRKSFKKSSQIMLGTRR